MMFLNFTIILLSIQDEIRIVLQMKNTRKKTKIIIYLLKRKLCDQTGLKKE